MVATVKPDLTRVWAEGAPGANVVDPDTTTPGKFDDGWLAEVPPFEHFNFLQKLFTQGLAHNNEQGINLWDTTTDYPVDALSKGSDGIVYISIVTPNVGNDPTSSPTDWIPTLTTEVDVDSIADLRLTPGGDGIQKASVKSYIAPNFSLANPYDGGGGEFLWDTTSTETDNGGTIIKVTAITTGRWIRIYSGFINIKWFGVTGDSITDQSTENQAALDFAATIVGASGAGSGATVWYPSGGYVMNNVTWPLHVNIVGEEVRLVSFFFGGVEAAQSTILSSVGQSFAHITGVSLLGWVPGDTKLAENLIRFESGALDLNHTIGDIALKGCKYNAIHQESGQVVNLHINRIRFDAVGGYGLRLKTFLGHESRPVSIDHFTLDNNNSALPAPYNAEPRWGLGLLRVIDGGHNTAVGTFQISNGRVEKNVKYRNTTYGDYTTGEQISTIALEGNGGAGAGQYKLELDSILVTGGSNQDIGESLATSLGYTSSSATTGVVVNCAMAASTSFIYVDNESVGKNLPATVIFDNIRQVPEQGLVRADMSVDQTAVGTGAFTTVEYDRDGTSSTIDSLGAFDTATFTYTPLREGWYRIHARAALTAGVDGTYCMLTILKGGTRFNGSPSHMSGTNPVGCEVTDLIFFDGITDNIVIELFHNAGSNRIIDSDTSKSVFTAERISSQ